MRKYDICNLTEALQNKDTHTQKKNQFKKYIREGEKCQMKNKRIGQTCSEIIAKVLT